MPRSTDKGKTFEPTINLSNSSDTHSDRAYLVIDRKNVYVSWSETSKNGKSEQVIRVSNDYESTFSSILKLTANATIGR
jgi:hypothetical protein